ncbi:MAG TPA: type 1 pili tip component [Gammaproteobacteria bacterium]|nr:type 1 pili tip component [Gammaproteobacteria bacterium]
MKMRELLETWEQSAGERRTRYAYSVRLPVHDAAKLAALADMFPGRSEQDIITDLLSTALDEIEAAFPYVAGGRVVAEDEQGDPIYEDVGQTPRFQRLTREHFERLEAEDEDE